MTRGLDHRWAGCAAFLLPLLIASLFAPHAALGQAALDQYVPEARPGGGSGGAGASGSGAPESGAAALDAGGAGIPQAVRAPQRGQAGGGTAPGTSYPLTPFVLIVGIGLVLGALARWIIHSRRRERT